MKKSKKRGCFFYVTIIVMLLLPVSYFIYYYYNQIFSSREFNMVGKYTYLYVPTGTDYNELKQLLNDKGFIENMQLFEWVAEQKNLPKHIHPGKYKIMKRMSINQLINLLRSGAQEPVRLTINSHIRFVRQIAGIAGRKLEVDSSDIMKIIYDSDFMAAKGFNRYTLLCLFIPNTYEFYWNTNAEQFLDRMYKEYTRFWNQTRLNKAKFIGLNSNEIITLASIVQLEVLRTDEKKRIAGVYINRLKKGMLLQADPTVIYANGNFSVRRVTRKMTQINSSYNTYKVKGLPPGPICIPDISTIDAVLNYEHHKYLYFCAKPDFSGYHSFAKTLTQHNLNARRYQQALNKRKIYQ